MKVDTSALLSTIRDIELRLSEHQRHDTLPAWAQSLVVRVDDMEKRANVGTALDAGFAANHARDPNSGLVEQRPMGPGINLAELAAEERLLQKLKENVDSHMNSTRVSLETKLSTTTLELERVHKLLQIRPTTSELQQVVLMVHDMSRRMQDGVRDVSASIRGLVQDKVAEEMQMIMAQLTSNQSLGEESIGIIAKKVDGYTEDISNIRKGMESACTVMDVKITASQREVVAATENVSKLRDQYESNALSVKQSMAQLSRAQETAAAVFAEYRNTVSESLMDVKGQMEDTVRNVGNMIDGSNTQMAAMQGIIEASKASIEDFRFTYEVDAKVQQSTNQTTNQSLAALEEKQSKFGEYLATLQDADVLKVLGIQTEQINRSKTMIDDIDATIGTISSKANKVAKAMASLEDEVRPFPGLVAEQAQRIDDLLSKNEKTNVMVASMQGVLDKTEKKLEELNALSVEMEAAKDATEELKNRLVQNQATVVTLLESSDDHERKLEQLQELMDGQEEGLQGKLQEMKGGLLSAITKKQSEVEAVVANLRENLDILANSMGGDLSSDGGTAGAIVGGSIQGGISGGGGGGGGYGGGAGFGGGHSRKGNASTKQAGVAGSSGGAGMRATSAGGGMPSLSQQEQNEVSLGNAEFIADLCMSFEEISVRKSYVGDIPPTMCEHIANTAQNLTGFIATCSDSEAIQKILRAGPKDLDYDDQLVPNLRQQKLDEFLNNVSSIILANNAQPGLIRTDARTLFLKQLNIALKMCMSKHDQVLVVSNTRFGGIKIPTCIACDRPLLDKVKRDNLVQPEDISQRRSFPGFGSHSQVEEMPSALTMSGVSGTAPPRNKVRGKGGSGAIRLPAPKSEAKIARPSSQGEAAQINPAMRNGLRMPMLDKAVLMVEGNAGADDRRDNDFVSLTQSQSSLF